MINIYYIILLLLFSSFLVQIPTATGNIHTQNAADVFFSPDRLIIEKEQRIMELELSLDQAAEASVDKEKLLETIQGDKTALSRAMAQNKDLKNQLAELQNSFVKMVSFVMYFLGRAYMYMYRRA